MTGNFNLLKATDDETIYCLAERNMMRSSCQSGHFQKRRREGHMRGKNISARFVERCLI